MEKEINFEVLEKSKEGVGMNIEELVHKATKRSLLVGLWRGFLITTLFWLAIYFLFLA